MRDRSLNGDIPMIDRNLVREIDWVLIALMLINAAVGCLLIYSATHDHPGREYLKQLAWLAAGCVALFLSLWVDYKVLITFSPFLYGLCLIVLGALLVFGRVIAGTKGWFRVGSVSVQPSEIIKLAMILLLARIFAEFRRTYVSFLRGVLSVAVVLLPMGLVLMQPDLGTASSYLVLLLAAFLLAGLNRKTLAVLLVAALLLGVAGWTSYLKDYQKKRILTLFSPSMDPRGSGYQINQSRIAIGSGGILGKGFRKGTQSQLRFLPARHTDFIFAVLGEEFGFLGVLAVMGLYLLLLLRLFRSVAKSRDRAGVYITFMVAILLSYQFLVNVLMVVGLFPVTGIPLPLLSYGGSSLLSVFLAVGLVLNVRMRRFVNI